MAHEHSAQKILVAGGGRCNVTHDVVETTDFNGSQKIIRNILAAFDVPATIEWFKSLGVNLKRETTGKLFPTTDSSRTVLSALVQRCESLKVELQTGRRVTDIIAPTESDKRFLVMHEGGTLAASRVIFCTGGRSLPRSGSDGSGWEILRRLGHSVTPTYAALAPLALASTLFHAALAGISQEVELSVFVRGKRIDHRRGSLLWTHFGISGPVVMDASRHWIIAAETGAEPSMQCNLLPGENFEEVERWLIDSISARPRAAVLTHLSGRMPERVAGCCSAISISTRQ